METLVQMRVHFSFHGTTTISLEREVCPNGNHEYYLVRDQSEFTGYRPGPDIRQHRVSPESAKPMISIIDAQPTGTFTKETAAVDGTTTEITIERGPNKLHLTWWGALPEEWHGLSDLIKFLDQELSAI